MASLLKGTGLAALLSGTAKPALLIGGAAAIVVPPPVSVPVWSGLLLSDVSPGNLAAWWDAGSLAGMLTAGATPTLWGGTINGLVDKSGNARPAALSNTGLGNRSPSGPVSVPRCVGALGGIAGFKTLSSGTYWPACDETVNITVPTVDLRASAAWTLTLTFSRPNLYQDSTYDGSQPVVAGARAPLTLGGTPILQLGNAVSDTLTLFPGAANVTLATGLPRMFTHSVTLVNTPGTGITAYLDDTQIASAVANPINAIGTLTLPCGNAQSYFHEAALWSKALSSAELTLLHGASATAAAKRWARGTRRNFIFLNYGQSNWNAAITTNSNKLLLQDLIRYHLGELSCWIGYNDGYGSILGNMLTGTATDAVAANLPLGAGASGMSAFITGLPADLRAMIAGQIEDWTEGATVAYGYSTLITQQLQAERQLTIQLRALAGVNFPRMSGYAVPYSSSSAQQGAVEMNAIMAATPADNSYIVMNQQLDTLPNGASYDPTTGAFGTAATGGVAGDSAHRDPADWPRVIRRIAPVVSRVVQAKIGGSLSAWPTGLPVNGGPQVAAAVYEGISLGRSNGGTATDTLLVTIAHDPGYANVSGCDFFTDGAGNLAYLDPTGTLRPSAATSGCNWLVVDGGTGASPTATVSAIACQRIDATHLRLTLTSRLSVASRTTHSNAMLYFGYSQGYPGGSLPNPSQFGRGNAIYDNYASLAKPAGWNPIGDFGVYDNMPLSLTPYGVVLT